MGQILMPTLIGYSEVSLWTDRIFGILCIIFVLSVLGFHIYTVRSTDSSQSTHSRAQKQHQQLIRLVNISVFSVIITALIGNIMWCWVIWNPFNSNCTDIWIVALLLYCINRVALFEFAVIRLKVVFATSPTLSYKSQVLRFLAIGSFIDVLISFWLAWWTLDIDQHEIGNNSGIYQCFQKNYLLPLMAVGVVDMVWMILLYWLFHRKMNSLFAMIQSMIALQTEDDNQLAKIAYVTRKLAVLLASSIISTWSLIFFLAFSSISLSALTLDMVMNCICMVLCDMRYDPIYLYFCKCVAKKDILTTRTDDNRQYVNNEEQKQNGVEMNVVASATNGISAVSAKTVSKSDGSSGDTKQNNKRSEAKSKSGSTPTVITVTQTVETSFPTAQNSKLDTDNTITEMSQ